MTALVLSPLADDIFTVLQAFVMNILGLDDTQVLQSLQNREAMPPPVPGFVMLTGFVDNRYRTNQHTWNTSVGGNPTVQSINSGMKKHIQVDFYSANAEDWSQTFCTVFRDDYAVLALAPTCAPLYADEGRQIPLVDGELQYEKRWLVDAHLAYTPTVVVPQEFADAVKVGLINVDVRYPP